MPEISPQQQLEQLSRKKFSLAFDESRFILKDENPDNGIDFKIELVDGSNIPGYNFIAQLKSSESIEQNNDGSYSYNIETSNIQYLSNTGQLSYYFLYIRSTDSIYYVPMSEFLISLNEKDFEWKKQPNHTLRFRKKLDEESKQEIYFSAWNYCESIHKLNMQLLVTSGAANTKNTVTLDKDRNVYSEVEILRFLEKEGFNYINSGKWKYIISLHEKVSGVSGKTALYNLVVGISYYNCGKFSEALIHLINSNKNSGELVDEYKPILKYFHLQVMALFSIISKVQYEEEVEILKDKGVIGLYIRLAQAKDLYLMSLSTGSKDAYNLVLLEYDEIINHEDGDEELKIIAKSDRLSVEAEILNQKYLSNLTYICLYEAEHGINQEMRQYSAYELTTRYRELISKLKAISMEFIEDNKNPIGFYHTELNRIRVLLEFIIFSNSISLNGQENKNSTQSKYDLSEDTMVKELLKSMDEAYKFYSSIGFITNVLCCLGFKYELLHFIGSKDAATATLSEMDVLASEPGFTEEKVKIEKLKMNGPNYEQFSNSLKQAIQIQTIKIKKQSDEKERLVSELEKMDFDEKQSLNKYDFSDMYEINLFPIGNFHIPKDKTETCFDILNISNSEVKNSFLFMFKESIVPIANVYNLVTEVEGYAGGQMAYRNFENFENMYRVRKAFYQNKFYKIIIEHDNEV